MKITESNVRKIVREELLRLMEQDEAEAPALDDLEFMSDERVAYEQWVKLNRIPSAEVQSVMVDYIVDQNLHADHDLHDKLAKEFGFDHDKIMAAVKGKLPADVDASTEEDVRQLDLAQVVEAISKI